MGEMVSGKIYLLFFPFKKRVLTHQTAAGPQAGHVCLTTGSELSPLLA